MAIDATYGSAKTFTAVRDAVGNTDLRTQCAPGIKIRADCGADGYRYGVVTAVSYADPVTTIEIAGDALTPNLTAFEHGNNSPATLANHGHTGLADGGVVAHAALSGVGSNTHAQIDAHLASLANPHGVTAAQASAVPLSRTIETQAPLSGGGDLSQDRALSLTLASLAGLLADQTTGGVITDIVLAAAVKLLISADTTIYVSTTGSDTAGNGSADNPFASLGKALDSIAGKSIATGVTLSIQLADGTYSIPSAIAVLHPDADKIQILGNLSAETTLTVVSVVLETKTIVVAGDQTAVPGLAAGDLLAWRVGASGNPGAYTVVSATCSGGNTEVVVAENISTATLSGDALTAMPANNVKLVWPANTTAINIFKPLSLIQGIRIIGSSPNYSTGIGLSKNTGPVYITKCILSGFAYGLLATNGGKLISTGNIIKSCINGQYANRMGLISDLTTKTIVDSCTKGFYATGMSLIQAISSQTIVKSNTTNYTPSLNTIDATGSLVSSS